MPHYSQVFLAQSILESPLSFSIDSLGKGPQIWFRTNRPELTSSTKLWGNIFINYLFFVTKTMITIHPGKKMITTFHVSLPKCDETWIPFKTDRHVIWDYAPFHSFCPITSMHACRIFQCNPLVGRFDIFQLLDLTDRVGNFLSHQKINFPMCAVIHSSVLWSTTKMPSIAVRKCELRLLSPMEKTHAGWFSIQLYSLYIF